MLSCDPEKFVNREKELALVKNKISRLARGEPLASHERVVHFVGPSGMGKSCLLEKIYQILTKEPACVPVLIALDKFLNRREELVGEFLASVYQEFCIYQDLSVNTILKKPAETLSKYSSMVVRAINLSAIDKMPVLLLDEVNILRKDELQRIEEYLLEELLSGHSRFILITAGRISVDWNDFSLRAHSKNTSILPAFDEKTTGEQLEKLRPGSAQLARKVHELASGIPGNIKILAEYGTGDLPQLQDELQVIQSLLRDLKAGIEERFHPIMEVLCILRTFFPEDIASLARTHPALGKQWDESRIKEIFPELKRVQARRGEIINWDREKKSWVMDESTRALFERELQIRIPDLWRKLHYTAYQMYEGWGEEYHSQVYKAKAVYHQECLQAAGYDPEKKG